MNNHLHPGFIGSFRAFVIHRYLPGTSALSCFPDQHLPAPRASLALFSSGPPATVA